MCTWDFHFHSLTFAGLLLDSDFVTIQANNKTTFLANPVHVEQRCVTNITHLPHSLHCSFPGNLTYRSDKELKSIYFHIQVTKLGERNKENSIQIAQTISPKVV